jgi:hypothetical protein
MTYPPPSPPVIGGIPANHSGTGNHPITRVVVHSAVMENRPGAARMLGAWNRNGTTGGSWHYAVDADDTFQCSYDRFVCWHAPPNSRSIGIEMADRPIPGSGRPGARSTTKARAIAEAAWRRSIARWQTPRHRRMLRRTARLVAELLLANDLPPVLLTPAACRAGRRGIATHATVSAAFGQSSHWDPGAWPERRFMRLVRKYYNQQKEANQ